MQRRLEGDSQNPCKHFEEENIPVVGRDSSVGIAIHYGLNGPGIEFRWRRDFRTRPEWPWGPPSLLYIWYRVFPEGKAAESWRWSLTPSSAEVKERVELYLYSTSGPSWPVIGWPLFFQNSRDHAKIDPRFFRCPARSLFTTLAKLNVEICPTSFSQLLYKHTLCLVISKSYSSIKCHKFNSKLIWI